MLEFNRPIPVVVEGDKEGHIITFPTAAHSKTIFGASFSATVGMYVITGPTKLESMLQVL